MYNMFSEDPYEQELYHATAAVTSLLLEIGEAGKLFFAHVPEEMPNQSIKETSCKIGEKKPVQVCQYVQGDVFSNTLASNGSGEDQMEEVKLEDSSPRDHGACSSMLISDDDTKDDSSMSSYSVLSAGSHEDDKLQCEDIGDDTILVRNHHQTSLPSSTSLDQDWAITFEQFLASLLTEPALVRYFDKSVSMMARIANAKNVQMMGKTLPSTSDYDIPTISG